MSRRVGLNYPDESACIADIELLRRGYVRAGVWDLAQSCYHCWWPIHEVLHHPSDDSTSKQSANALVEFMNQFVRLASGTVCDELPSPPRMKPASHTDPSAIDDLIDILREMKNYPHKRIDHFLAGSIDFARFRQFVLLHNAHHFSFFVPTEGN